MNQHRWTGRRIALCRLMLGPVGSPEARLTQEELASRVGDLLGQDPPTKMTVSRWETGRTEPSLGVLSAVAEVYRVDPGWLAFGDDSGAASPMPGIVAGLGDNAEGIMAAMKAFNDMTTPKQSKRATSK